MTPGSPVAGSPVVVEACVTSVAEAVASERAGADRLELCRDLEVGGLTPPPTLVAEVVERVEVPVFVMVRPRPGDFRARPGELARMLRSLAELRAAGAGGVVVGVLDDRGRIDETAMAELVSAAGDLPVTCHRAFDEVDDADAALEALAELGVARLLTGGGGGRAWEGRARLTRLVERAGAGLTIVAGGGVRGDHVVDLVRATGVREVHARAAGVPGVVEALRTSRPASPRREAGAVRPGVLQLIRARLDAPPVPHARLVEVLSAAERDRIARFRFPELRRRHEAATGLLRIVLAGFAGADPAALRFEVGEHGKPRLPGGPSFNLSHSGEWWLFGVAAEGRVGVDVEVHRPLRDLADLARSTFHPDEAADVLAGATDDERRRAFFRVWSRKEAFIKAVGRGLSYDLRGFRVAADEGPDRELLGVDDPDDDPHAWQMRSVAWAPDVAAAVAWDRPHGRVEWAPPPSGNA